MDQDPNQRPQDDPRRMDTTVPGVPPPPRTGMGRGTKIAIGIGGGCLVLLLLSVVGLVGCLAIVGSNVDTDPEPFGTPDGDQPFGSGDPEEGPTVAVGEPVTVGDVRWVVTEVEQVNRLESQFGQFGEPKQGNFVVVDFDFTNNSSEPLTLASQSVALLDVEGRESQPDTDTFEYIPNDRNIFLEQVNPGVTDRGRVIFTVAPGASGFTLQVGDARAFSDENGYVDLGL